MRQLKINDAITEYLQHVSIERGLAINTVNAYRRDLTRYSEYLHSRDRKRPADVTNADAAEFVVELSRGSDQHPPLSRSSVSRVTSAVRSLHKFWLAEGLVDVDVASDVSPAVPSRSLPKALTLPDVLSILSAPSPDEPAGLRDRALLEFLYGTGARVSEAVNLQLRDLDVDARQVSLRGKGNKQRILPLGSHAADALESYLVRARPAFASKAVRGTEAVFLNQRGGTLTRQSAWNILKAAAESSGTTGDVSPHVLRHSFATHLMDGGADVRVVQELLGHASVTTTQIYTLVTVDKLREVYLTSHPRALA